VGTGARRVAIARRVELQTLVVAASPLSMVWIVACTESRRRERGALIPQIVTCFEPRLRG
jgi:hypothetical protein